MRKIHKRAFFCTAIILVFLVFLGYFLWSYGTDSKAWFVQRYNRQLYTDDGQLMQGVLLDRNGTVLSYAKDGKRLYAEDALLRMATLHVVGDAESKIGSGALMTLTNHLVSYSPMDGADATATGNLCYLTIDGEACKVALKAMNGKTGTVAVYNYKTGEIMCLVSTPTYDPADIPENLETAPEYEGAYVNRFFSSAFRPGSVFKTVTLHAALENLTGVSHRIFECTGSVTIGDNQVTCQRAHGKMNLQTAYAYSCNCTFAQLAVEIGGTTLLDYAQSTGLTSSYSICGISTARGSFEMATVEDYQLGYAGVGLYHDLVNPCSLLIYYGAIAAGGTSALPTYLRQVTDEASTVLYTPETAYSPTLITPETAELVRTYMMNNVNTMYGTDRFPDLPMGAKSGTIETKTGDSDCWFAGFLADDNYPYAFVVYLEDAGSGSRVAGSVAGAVLKALVK